MPTKVTFLPALMMAFLAILSSNGCEETCDIGPPNVEQSAWGLYELNNSGSEPTREYNNSAPKETFGLRIHYYMPISRVPKSCPDNYYEFQNPVTEVIVYAMQDLDSTHIAGASLNNYFIVRNQSLQTNLPFYKSIPESIDAFIKYPYNLIGAVGAVGAVDLIMVHPPVNPGKYQFKVKLKFTRSDSITLESRLITLY